jgi:hypothetical protein
VLTALARPGKVINLSDPHVIFPQFICTDLDDKHIQSVFIRTGVRYLTTNSMVQLPFVKVIRQRLKSTVDFYLCPFCNLVEMSRDLMEEHVYVHLHLKFAR